MRLSLTALVIALVSQNAVAAPVPMDQAAVQHKEGPYRRDSGQGRATGAGTSSQGRQHTVPYREGHIGNHPDTYKPHLLVGFDRRDLRAEGNEDLQPRVNPVLYIGQFVNKHPYAIYGTLGSLLTAAAGLSFGSSIFQAKDKREREKAAPPAAGGHPAPGPEPAPAASTAPLPRKRGEESVALLPRNDQTSEGRRNSKQAHLLTGLDRRNEHVDSESLDRRVNPLIYIVETARVHPNAVFGGLSTLIAAGSGLTIYRAMAEAHERKKREKAAAAAHHPPAPAPAPAPAPSPVKLAENGPALAPRSLRFEGGDDVDELQEARWTPKLWHYAAGGLGFAGIGFLAQQLLRKYLRDQKKANKEIEEARKKQPPPFQDKPQPEREPEEPRTPPGFNKPGRQDRRDVAEAEDIEVRARAEGPNDSRLPANFQAERSPQAFERRVLAQGDHMSQLLPRMGPYARLGLTLGGGIAAVGGGWGLYRKAMGRDKPKPVPIPDEDLQATSVQPRRKLEPSQRRRSSETQGGKVNTVIVTTKPPPEEVYIEPRFTPTHRAAARVMNDNISTRTKFGYALGAAGTAGLGLVLWKVIDGLRKKKQHEQNWSPGYPQSEPMPGAAPAPAPAPAPSPPLSPRDNTALEERQLRTPAALTESKRSALDQENDDEVLNARLTRTHWQAFQLMNGGLSTKVKLAMGGSALATGGLGVLAWMIIKKGKEKKKQEEEEQTKAFPPIPAPAPAPASALTPGSTTLPPRDYVALEEEEVQP